MGELDDSFLEGHIVASGEHPTFVGDDDVPVPIFLVRGRDGQMHAFLPMFREDDYGMLWFEIRGPVGFQENLAKWKLTDRRFASMGMVRWRLKK